MIDSIHYLHEYLRPHLLCLVDAGDRCHLTVFVSSKDLTHRARGHTMGHTVNVDLFFLVNITHWHSFLSLWRWLAAVGFKENSGIFLSGRTYIPVHIDVTYGL